MKRKKAQVEKASPGTLVGAKYRARCNGLPDSEVTGRGGTRLGIEKENFRAGRDCLQQVKIRQRGNTPNLCFYGGLVGRESDPRLDGTQNCLF